MDEPPFHYQPRCSIVGCDRYGVFKVAAPWTYGNIRELKNYGVCCEEHRDPMFARARDQAALAHLAEGEAVGDVGVYQILPGVRDAELTRVE